MDGINGFKVLAQKAYQIIPDESLFILVIGALIICICLGVALSLFVDGLDYMSEMLWFIFCIVIVISSVFTIKRTFDSYPMYYKVALQVIEVEDTSSIDYKMWDVTYRDDNGVINLKSTKKYKDKLCRIEY